MRDFCKVSPSIWKSRKFRALKADSDARLAYLYILTNPHTNSAGCYDLPVAYACADLEWEMKRYRKAIDSLCIVDLILLDENESTVLVTQWIKFQFPSNPKHALGMLSQLEEASSKPLKLLRCNEIKEYVERRKLNRDREVGQTIINRIDSLSKAYAEAMCTKTQTQTQTGDSDSDSDSDSDLRISQDVIRQREEAAASHVNGSASSDGEEEAPSTVSSHLLETPLMRRVGR